MAIFLRRMWVFGVNTAISLKHKLKVFMDIFIIDSINYFVNAPSTHEFNTEYRQKIWVNM